MIQPRRGTLTSGKRFGGGVTANCLLGVIHRRPERILQNDEEWLVIYRVRAALGLALLFTFAAAQAHHAFSVFDMTKTVTLSGTVREFQWTNPHSFIQLLVPTDGAIQEWSIEMGSPMNLMRIGWKPKSLRAGDKITLVIHPARDATKGGSFMFAISSDGKPLGN